MAMLCRLVHYGVGSSLAFFKKLMSLFLAALGLHCCPRAFSSCREHRPLTEGAPPVAEQPGTQASVVPRMELAASVSDSRGCGLWRLWRAGFVAGATWDPSRPGSEAASAALAGGLLSTAAPGKSSTGLFQNL